MYKKKMMPIFKFTNKYEDGPRNRFVEISTHGCGGLNKQPPPPYTHHDTYFSLFGIIFHHNAGNKMDFTRGKFKPKSASSILQAIICRFFGCNSVILVNSLSPQVEIPPQESRVGHLSGADMSATLLHEVSRS